MRLKQDIRLIFIPNYFVLHETGDLAASRPNNHGNVCSLFQDSSDIDM